MREREREGEREIERERGSERERERERESCMGGVYSPTLNECTKYDKNMQILGEEESIDILNKVGLCDLHMLSRFEKCT